MNSSALTSLVNSCKGSYMYLGAFSQNESNSNSYANLDLTLQVSFSVPPANVTITADNNFTASDGTTHGSIIVDGNTRTAPYPFSKTIGQSVTLLAVSSQTDNQGYQRIWHAGTTNTSQWEKNGIYKDNTQSITFNAAENDNNAIYKADLRKAACNAKFQTGGVGIGNSNGTIVVSSTNYSSPTPNFPVVESNAITVTYPWDFWVNNIHYCFAEYDWWNRTFTYYPNENVTYTQNYAGYPDYDLNLHFNSYNPRDTTNNIILYWNEYPNTAVTQYRIWRYVNYGHGDVHTDLLATVNRGTTTYTDGGFWIRNSSNGMGLLYKVSPYYSTEGTNGDAHVNWVATYGDGSQVGKSNANTTESKTIVSNYSLANYPNPFNPTTRIEYQLPKAGFVTVKVYNALGKEVAMLVNDRKDEGKYFTEFNGAELSSGIYFCELRANEFVTMKKMLLVK
ncbi:MAG: T9SS type A sorting domain-containing protein [Ignavibacteriales bacterium]|nr:T9SS type A sorting domain-containing protein [Ignavibacteriales bacterium]